MRKLLALLLSLSLLLVPTACSPSAQQPQAPDVPAQSSSSGGEEIEYPKSLVIAASNVGNIWYNNAVKISEILMANFPGMSVTVIEGGGDANIDAVNQGTDVQLALTSSTSLLPALAGTNNEVTDASNVYALMSCGQSVAQTAVLADSDIQDFPDLVGKRVAAGDYKQVAMYTFLALLDAYGIPQEDVQIQAASSSEYPDMFSDGLLDACHINGNLPLSTLVQIDSGDPIRLLQPSQEAVKTLLEKYPSFYTVDVPAGQYAGQTEPLTLLAYDGMLIANKDLPGPFLAKLVELVTEDATLDPAQFSRAHWDAYPTFISADNTAPEVWAAIEAHQ